MVFWFMMFNKIIVINYFISYHVAHYNIMVIRHSEKPFQLVKNVIHSAISYDYCVIRNCSQNLLFIDLVFPGLLGLFNHRTRVASQTRFIDCIMKSKYTFINAQEN